MTDPDLVAVIRNYDIICLIETIKKNDFTLAVPGYKFLHVSRKHKEKNACRASGSIGILISNKCKFNQDRPHLRLFGMVDISHRLLSEKNIKIGCAYIPPKSSPYVGVRNDYFTMLEEEVARYIEMHHILLCSDSNSRTGKAPDYESGVNR